MLDQIRKCFIYKLRNEKEDKPLTFKQLRYAKLNNTLTEKEILEVQWALEYFINKITCTFWY